MSEENTTPAENEAGQEQEKEAPRKGRKQKSRSKKAPARKLADGPDVDHGKKVFRPASYELPSGAIRHDR